jgi:hypothetical protein
MGVKEAKNSFSIMRAAMALIAVTITATLYENNPPFYDIGYPSDIIEVHTADTQGEG